jgi:carboxyl-terminal processing protease
MNQNTKIWLPLVVALALIVILETGFIFFPLKNKPSLFGSSIPSVEDQVYEFIRANYVDTINDSIYKFKNIDSLLITLDPHSVYIPPVQSKRVDELLGSSFGGIGVEFAVVNDTVLVIDVIKDGPAFKVGLLKGDKVLAVNDTSIAGKNIENEIIFKKMRGTINTKLKVLVLRDNKSIVYTITRGTISNPSLESAYMIDKTIGYIRLDRFSDSTYDEFVSSLKKLNSLGLKKLILDLRGNGGGYLNEATEILDEFINENKILVYTEGRAYAKQQYKTRVFGEFEMGALIVLIDDGSASASEVIAGCLQDYDRATIIGERSFGKGLVQNQYKLTNGGYLRLTVAKYFTPSGRCIQKPYGLNKEKYYHEVLDRDDTSIHQFEDTTSYFTASGRIVHAGGGITPDIEVKEKSLYTKDELNIYNNIYIQEAAYQYASLNYKDLIKKYPTIDNFLSNYQIDPKILASFLKTNEDNIQELNIPHLKNDFCASVARYLYDRSAMYRIINQNDLVIQKALEVLKSK